MTLIDLVKKYKGDARFDVNGLVDDNSEDVVVFLNNEAEAIKDTILNADVVRFRVSGIHDGLPTINVLVRETTEPDNKKESGEEATETKTEDTPQE